MLGVFVASNLSKLVNLIFNLEASETPNHVSKSDLAHGFSRICNVTKKYLRRRTHATLERQLLLRDRFVSLLYGGLSGTLE